MQLPTSVVPAATKATHGARADALPDARQAREQGGEVPFAVFVRAALGVGPSFCIFTRASPR